jgi:hypothetical protein
LLKTAESLRVKGLAQATQDKKTNGEIDPFSKVTPSCQTSSEITSKPPTLPSQAQASTTVRIARNQFQIFSWLINEF